MSEFRNDKYRITTASLGSLMVASGVALSLSGIITEFIIVSCLLSLGTSCLFHTLLGGIEKGELDVNAEEKNKLLGVLPQYVANIKITGPVITFIVLLSIFFGCSMLQSYLESQGKINANSILKKVKLEPSEGLIVAAKDYISPEINLSYRNGRSNEIKHRINMSSDEDHSKNMLSGNQLEIFFDEIDKANSAKFRIKKSDYSLGNIESQKIEKLLKDLAKKTSRDNGNSLTQAILHDCADIEGVCEVPKQYQVKVYFDSNMDNRLNEAKICPKHPVLSMNRITNKHFSLTEKKDSFRSEYQPIRINTFSRAGEFCTEDSFNSIRVASKYKLQLFPKGSDSKQAFLSYTLND